MTTLRTEHDVHATYGFFDHVERLEFRIQPLMQLLFHFLPFVLPIDSGHLEMFASSNFPEFLKILIDGISCLSLVFSGLRF